MAKKIFLPIFFCLIAACSNSSDEFQVAPDILGTSLTVENLSNAETYEGMSLIEGSNDTITLGTNQEGAKASETPEMKVVLDYDYFLENSEVSCQEFKSVMEESKISKNIVCKDSLPITNITFFDAVLFANQKSKSAELDTVYDYSSTVYDDEGHCTNMVSFTFHAERKGFRIPTETEWVKGASQKDNAFSGFSGTVMEWTNDHLGKLKDSTIRNYAGAANANDIGERVVKGAINRADTTKINVLSRGDVYEVTSASRTDYVGFRLAIGIIPTPAFLGKNGTTTSSPITIHAKSADLWTYTRTDEIKLAFRNDETGNLNYINYAEDGSNVIEITDTIPVYHPDISPDGQRVAFCTGLEGILNKSELYVRNLDEKGSGLVKLEVESAAIPRWSILENGDTVITYVTDAGNNKDNAEFTEESTWQVSFSGGKFGTPHKLFRGNYHGGISEDGNLAVTGARLLRARIDDKDTIWNDGEQACNASLAKDFSKRTAFLDFGKKTDKNYIGKKYGVHEYLIIADSTGKTTRMIHAPNGYTFDHTEWALGKVNENIVTTLTNTNGAHTRIALVNLKDSSITNLAEGVELWHPSLWIKGKMQNSVQNSSSTTQSSNSDNADSSSAFNDSPHEPNSSLSENAEFGSSSEELFEFDPDSAGMYYNTTGACGNADRYRYKMEFLWQYKDTANVAVLGSSRSYYGVNPLEFHEPIFAVNFATHSAVISGSSYYFNNYILPHLKKLKAVIISIDLDRARISGLNSENMFYNAYNSYPGYVYDKNHNFWKGQNTKALFEMTFNSPGGSTTANELRPTRGFGERPANGWGEPTVAFDSCWMDNFSKTYQNNLNLFKDFVQTCKENNIYVIGVIFPQNPKYQETGAFGYHGLRRSEAHTLIEEIQNISKTSPNFILMDENKFGNHDYTDDMARDSDHLAGLGAEQLTHRLDSLIRTLDIEWE